jgi:hypothetical protein
MIPTLDQFILEAKKRSFQNNSYVKEPGFKSLYVRYGRRFLDGKWVQDVLDLASIQATRPGRGALTHLIARLRKDYSGMSLYVESIFNPRLPRKLETLGFKSIDGIVPNYYLLGDS